MVERQGSDVEVAASYLAKRKIHEGVMRKASQRRQVKRERQRERERRRPQGSAGEERSLKPLQLELQTAASAPHDLWLKQRAEQRLQTA